LFITSQKYDAGITVCNFIRVENDAVPDNRLYQENEFFNQAELYSPISALAELFDGKRYVAFTVVWNKLYKKELFGDIRYPVGRIHEDEAVTYKLLHRSERIVYIDIAMYYYVQREGSIMKSAFSEKRFDFALAYRERMEYMIRNQMFEKEAVKLYLWKYMDLLLEYKRSLSKMNRDYVKHRRQLRKDFNNNKRFLPVKERIKFLFRMNVGFIYRKLRSRYK